MIKVTYSVRTVAISESTTKNKKSISAIISMPMLIIGWIAIVFISNGNLKLAYK